MACGGGFGAPALKVAASLLEDGPALLGHAGVAVCSGYSRARSTCAGRAASGRSAKARPATRLASAPAVMIRTAETGSKRNGASITNVVTHQPPAAPAAMATRAAEQYDESRNNVLLRRPRRHRRRRGGWWVTTFVMEAPFRFEPVSAVLIVAGGALASLVAGLAFALRPLAARPAQALRARE